LANFSVLSSPSSITPSFMLSSTTCITAGRAPRRAEPPRRLLGGGERLLAVLQIGDVAVDDQLAAVVERAEVDLDIASRDRQTFVTRAFRLHQQLHLVSNRIVVIVAFEVSAFGLELRDVAHPGAGVDDVGRVALEFAQPVIDEFEFQIGTDQGDAVGHVFQNLLQHRAAAHRVEARGFGLGAGLFGQLLGLREGFLTLLQFRDVAIDAEYAAVLERLEVEFDILAARGAALVGARRRA
jgi:hypothetical protein